jgi:hypothetical protein
MHTFVPVLLAVLIIPLAVGALAAARAGRPRRVAPSGLVFHAFGKRAILDVSYVRAATFARFAEELSAAGRTTRTVREHAAAASCGNDGTAAALLTFDDGLADFYSIALPALTRCALRATVFPVVAFTGGTTAADVFGRQQHLSTAQLRQVASLGHEIGSHTMTHADLTLLAPAALVRELADSKHALEDALGSAVTSLSFPYGRWNPLVWERAREIGYTAATVYGCTTHLPGLIPVLGAYAFDSVDDLCRRLAAPRGVAAARADVMPHFARGTPLWHFRPCYRLQPWA